MQCWPVDQPGQPLPFRLTRCGYMQSKPRCPCASPDVSDSRLPALAAAGAAVQQGGVAHLADLRGAQTMSGSQHFHLEMQRPRTATSQTICGRSCAGPQLHPCISSSAYVPAEPAGYPAGQAGRRRPPAAAPPAPAAAAPVAHAGHPCICKQVEAMDNLAARLTNVFGPVLHTKSQ